LAFRDDLFRGDDRIRLGEVFIDLALRFDQPLDRIQDALLDPCEGQFFVLFVGREKPCHDRVDGDVYLILDTLSRALAGGDENSSVDMGRLIARCDAVREMLGCTLEYVHHSGKDKSRGARGWSGLGSRPTHGSRPSRRS
jgi:hypothetical protein